jgi:hypothetical protein
MKLQVLLDLMRSKKKKNRRVGGSMDRRLGIPMHQMHKDHVRFLSVG